MVDWQIGDWALCLNKRNWIQPPTNRPIPGPERGAVHQVVAMKAVGDIVGLGFAAWPEEFYHEKEFQKLDEDIEDDNDEEVIGAYRKQPELEPA